MGYTHTHRDVSCFGAADADADADIAAGTEGEGEGEGEGEDDAQAEGTGADDDEGDADESVEQGESDIDMTTDNDGGKSTDRKDVGRADNVEAGDAVNGKPGKESPKESKGETSDRDEGQAERPSDEDMEPMDTAADTTGANTSGEK
mmetsp:Transcript_10772/g.32981  ORF Transcript_10772/g.32981 Transcript_10772/m.32981 type:complete len:147 (+) Transcript_10772:1307-1747(+)